MPLPVDATLETTAIDGMPESIDDRAIDDDTPQASAEVESRGNVIALPPKDQIQMLQTSEAADIAFHSPSNQILGTPFTTDIDASRFEYPFPITTSDPSSSPAMILTASFPSPPPTHYAPLPSPTHTIPLTGFSSAPSNISSFSGSGSIFSFPPNSTSASGPFPAYTYSYSATHPKMRATPPPIPPSLAKKRQRWSLALPLPSVLRRRGSQSSPDVGGVPAAERGETRSASIDIVPGAQNLGLGQEDVAVGETT